jgi:hypothetical protein
MAQAIWDPFDGAIMSTTQEALEEAVYNLLADLAAPEVAAAWPAWAALHPNTPGLIYRHLLALGRLLDAPEYVQNLEALAMGQQDG